MNSMDMPNEDELEEALLRAARGEFDTPSVPAVRVTTINGEAWLNAADLAVWARFSGTEAGRELAAKVVHMADSDPESIEIGADDQVFICGEEIE